MMRIDWKLSWGKICDNINKIAERVLTPKAFNRIRKAQQKDLEECEGCDYVVFNGHYFDWKEFDYNKVAIVNAFLEYFTPRELELMEKEQQITNKVLECVNFIIRNYLNNKEERTMLENNMIYYRNRLDEQATTKQAFSYVIQSPISMFTSNRDEEQTICNTLWNILESKNHTLTKLW